MSNKIKNILFITGSRSDFATIKGVFNILKKTKTLKLGLFVTGMHTIKNNDTTGEITAHGISISGRHNISSDNHGDSFVEETKAILEYLKRKPADYVVVCGDRIEMLAAAAAAMIEQIPIFHIHGGDVTYGMIDDKIRHAITKMASVHFAASPLSKLRIKNMGEESWRIFQTGSPDLDELQTKTADSQILNKYGLNRKNYCMLLFHPESLAREKNAVYAEQIISALDNTDKRVVVLYPNGDPDSKLISKAYQDLAKEKYIKFSNLKRNEYLALLKNAAFLTGNSSSGIIEAATFKTPVINLGHRQDGRERNENIIDVPSISKKRILAAIQKLDSESFQKKLKKTKNIYGSGNAGLKIVKQIISITKKYDRHRLLYKKFKI